MGQPYPDDDDEAVPRKSKRGAVTIFLIGWIVLPFVAVLFSELETPWIQIASVGTLAFIVVFVVASVRVVRNF